MRMLECQEVLSGALFSDALSTSAETSMNAHVNGEHSQIETIEFISHISPSGMLPASMCVWGGGRVQLPLLQYVVVCVLYVWAILEGCDGCEYGCGGCG